MMNKTIAEYFQDAFIGIEFSSDIVQRHEGYLDNVELIDGVLAALGNGELFNEEGTGALDIAYGINALVEYGYYIFTSEAADMQGAHADAALGNSKLWGIGKGYTYAYTSEATVSLLGKAESGETDFAAEIAVYERERAAQLKLMGDVMTEEISSMAELAKLLSK